MKIPRWLTGKNAQIAELEVNSTNYEASLKIEKTSLALAEKELDRLQSLQSRSAAAAADVDMKQREVLVQQQQVQNLENSLKLIPFEEKSLQAALAVKRSSLQQVEIDLEKTNIYAPFDCRLGKLTIEVGQFVTAGEMLFEAHSTAVTEIEAQIALHEARRLIDPATASSLPEVTDTEALRDAVELGVTVRLRSGDVSAEWKGRLERLREEFDSQTRTLGFIVAVDKPYEKIIPGRRPALVRGMYCEVELQGTSRENRVIIPRSALHNGHVYLLDADQRLQRRAVKIDFAQSNFICLKSGLNEGDTLVVSDPVPAIEGMLVEPVADNDLRQSLIQEATREGAVE